MALGIKDAKHLLCLTMEYVEKHPEKPWNWDGLSSSPNATIEYVEKRINELNLKYSSENPNSEAKYILQHMNGEMLTMCINLFTHEAKVFREKLNERINFNL